MIRTTLEAETAMLLYRKIEKYLIDYHPAGYGTFLEDIGSTNGIYWAKITRSKTSD